MSHSIAMPVQEPAPVPARAGARRLLVLFVTAFVDMIGVAMIVPLLPYYAEAYGASALTVGLVISSFSLAQLAVAPLWGRWSDRHGRRPAIVAGLGITAAGYALFAGAASIPLLLLARVVQGIGGGTIGVVQAYVADSTPADRRTRSLGWLSAVTSLGAVVGPALGSTLVAAGGRAMPGITAAVLALGVAALGWRHLAEPPQPDHRTAEHGAVARPAIGVVVRHWREPAARLIWLYAIGIGAFYGVIPLVPLVLHDRLGITAETIGPFFMYLGAMGVLMRAVALGRLVERFGEPVLVRGGMVALGVGLALVGLGEELLPIAVGFTLMPIGTACLFPAVTALLSGAVSRGERGVYLGVQQAFGGVTRVAFPLLAGAAMDGIGIGTPLVVAGVLVVAALPLTAGFAAAGQKPA
ncbi:MAG TPA: MFS transporter [Gemmatimonadaceae bacterium]|nr:MFS transporter [Gemmatimonadaceae bacterium]